MHLLGILFSNRADLFTPSCNGSLVTYKYNFQTEETLFCTFYQPIILTKFVLLSNNCSHTLLCHLITVAMEFFFLLS
jgi:hypothetical protein